MDHRGATGVGRSSFGKRMRIKAAERLRAARPAEWRVELDRTRRELIAIRRGARSRSRSPLDPHFRIYARGHNPPPRPPARIYRFGMWWIHEAWCRCYCSAAIDRTLEGDALDAEIARLDAAAEAMGRAAAMGSPTPEPVPARGSPRPPESVEGVVLSADSSMRKLARILSPPRDSPAPTQGPAESAETCKADAAAK